MGATYVGFDPDAPAGERIISEEVRAEVVTLAPSTIDPGSITASKLAANSVTTAKIAAGAVTSVKIASLAVDTANLAAGAVTESKLEDGSVTAAKAGTGVVTAYDVSDNAIALSVKVLTAAEYGSIGHNPNTLYFITP